MTTPNEPTPFATECLGRVRSQFDADVDDSREMIAHAWVRAGAGHWIFMHLAECFTPNPRDRDMAAAAMLKEATEQEADGLVFASETWNVSAHPSERKNYAANLADDPRAVEMVVCIVQEVLQNDRAYAAPINVVNGKRTLGNWTAESGTGCVEGRFTGILKTAWRIRLAQAKASGVSP